MPETKTEWAWFVLGLVVIAVLVYSVVESRLDNRNRHPRATASQPASFG